MSVRFTDRASRSSRGVSLVGGALLALSLGVLSATLASSPARADSSKGPDGHAAKSHSKICGRVCDGAPVSTAKTDRLAATNQIFGRSVELHIDYRQALGWGTITGDPTDEIWLDRSFDGGKTVADSRLGDSTIADGTRTVDTGLFNLGDNHRTAVLRACGKAGNRPDVVCTDWSGNDRPPKPTSPARGAVDALVKPYNKQTGLFNTTGWWNSANALTGIIDYAQASGDHRYDWIIANTYEKNLSAQGGNFTNDYIDDTGWWGLAWTRAYDYTNDARYLTTARVDADYMASFSDNTCGGGLWWSTARSYKNAITNELFIKLSAELHNRIRGDHDYLDQSVSTWTWFKASGMINSENLINDGLDNGTCASNGGETWSYNQGVILGGLNDLFAATHDRSYLTQARTLADSSSTSSHLNPNGVLTEPCEARDCGSDGPTFKGVYVRNLGELNSTVQSSDYRHYLARQATVSWHRDRNAFNQYGVHWSGPLVSISAATQASAVDAQVAALGRRH